MTNLEDYLTTKEAAALTGYARQYIANLLQAGKIEGLKKGERWLVNRRSILDYKARNEAESKEDSTGLITRNK